MYQQSAPETIQALFASIAKNYDRANTTFSFGLHKKWNQRLIDAMDNRKRLLDLCAGTGEIGLGFLKKNPTARALLLDFCPEMLAIAAHKGVDFKERFEVIQADAQAIPLPDASVDAVSIAYGIRNVKNPEKCFQEVYRVLAPGGCFGILELTRPTSWLPRIGHRLYTRLVLPLLGKIVAKNTAAYHYLASSVETFASPDALESTLRKVGFTQFKRTPLTLGTVTLFLAVKGVK